MFATRIFIFFTGCISIMMTAQVSAQNNNFANSASFTCADDFVLSNTFKLCATNAFAKPAFKELNSSQNCAPGYARLANSRLCLLNNKRTRLTFKHGQLSIVKATKEKCGSAYIRLPNQKACVHKRVGLTTNDAKLKLVQTASLTCNAKDPESKVCKFKCANGFFRSPELGVCVDYNAALRSNVVFSTQECKNINHWKKLEASGLCVPRMVLSIVRNSTGRYVIEPNENDLSSCRGGAEVQITSMVLNPETNDTSSQANATGVEQQFNIEPVMYCMVRPRPRK